MLPGFVTDAFGGEAKVWNDSQSKMPVPVVENTPVCICGITLSRSK